MSDSAGWLADVTIVNESRSIGRPGDVEAYRSVGEACRSIEAWWVKDREGFVLNGLGEQLMLGVEGDRVFVVSREGVEDGETLVRRWLLAAAAAVLASRVEKARKGRAVLSSKEEAGSLPSSTEGLLAYVGFSD